MPRGIDCHVVTQGSLTRFDRFSLTSELVYLPQRFYLGQSNAIEYMTLPLLTFISPDLDFRHRLIGTIFSLGTAGRSTSGTFLFRYLWHDVWISYTCDTMTYCLNIIPQRVSEMMCIMVNTAKFVIVHLLTIFKAS